MINQKILLELQYYLIKDIKILLINLLKISIKEKILINTDGKFFTQSIGVTSQPIEISEDYLNYQHEWTRFSFLKIKNDTHLWGISDKQGNIIIPAKYNYISPISKERFIAAIVSEEKIKVDEPMKSHTTFRVGGPAAFFVAPETKEETAYDKFFAVFRQIILFPKMIFDKLFGRFFK